MQTVYAAHTVSQDITALMREIDRALSERSPLNGDSDAISIPALLLEFGYSEDLDTIASGIQTYLDNTRQRLDTLYADGAPQFIERYEDFDSYAKAQVQGTFPDIGLAQSLIQRLRSTLAVIDLRAGAKRIKQAAAGAMRWVHTVTTWLKNISSALWAILANLMTPTQWSFSGNVGTAMFGLANLEIEVTFGDGNRPSSAKTA